MRRARRQPAIRRRPPQAFPRFTFHRIVRSQPLRPRCKSPSQLSRRAPAQCNQLLVCRCPVSVRRARHRFQFPCRVCIRLGHARVGQARLSLRFLAKLALCHTQFTPDPLDPRSQPHRLLQHRLPGLRVSMARLHGSFQQSSPPLPEGAQREGQAAVAFQAEVRPPQQRLFRVR